MVFRAERLVWLCGVLLFPLSGRAADGGEVSVRILPQPVSTNHSAFRLGLRADFTEHAEEMLQAERLQEPVIAAAIHALSATNGVVGVTTALEPNTGKVLYTVTNTGGKPDGLSLTATGLRKGVRHTLRVTCRRERGSAAMRFGFTPADGKQDETTGKRVTVNGNGSREVALGVTPHRDGAFVCAFQIEPGSVMTFSGFSLMPEDAQEGFDSQALQALKMTGAGFLRWSAQGGTNFYNWYDGVGPRVSRNGKGQAFGTFEAVRLCRLVDAQPVFQVPVFQAESADSRVPDRTTAVQLAADWVAYCNATGGHPLALLRLRHGSAEPLNVRQWELIPSGGGQKDTAEFRETCRLVAAAMRAEDPAIEVRVAAVLPPAMDKPDPYVTHVLERLAKGTAADREYFQAWYEALGAVGAALRRVNPGATAQDRTCAPFEIRTVLQQGLYAKHMLREAGLLTMLVNHFPMTAALATDVDVSKQEGAAGAFRVQAEAAWGEDKSVLLVFVYNAGPEPQTVRIDLSALKRRFVLYAAEQVAADITSRRVLPTVPILRKQKAGSALSQVVLCEAAPSSLTRVLVKE